MEVRQTAPPGRAEWDCILVSELTTSLLKAPPLPPDGPHTLRAEPARTAINRGEEPRVRLSADREREGIDRREGKGEERTRGAPNHVVKQGAEPPRTETDWLGPDMGRPAGWHPAGVHAAEHGQVALHGTLHVSFRHTLSDETIILFIARFFSLPV